MEVDGKVVELKQVYTKESRAAAATEAETRDCIHSGLSGDVGASSRSPESESASALPAIVIIFLHSLCV